MSTLPTEVATVCDHFLDEVDSRLPGRLTGLLLHGSICWGEFFPGSDIDFVAVWDQLPEGDELEALREAHEVTTSGARAFDGFHCTAADLAGSAAGVGSRPAYYQGTFDPAGDNDINPVTWHELAERPVVVRGEVPFVHTDLEALLAFTRDNLDTYWRSMLARVDRLGVGEVGQRDELVCWIALGAPRLHHLLVNGTLTSKSGAGRHVIGCLDPRWHRIASEALRIRERPTESTLYDDALERGTDVRNLLRWIVDSAGDLELSR